MRDYIKLFKALSDETRLRILEFLIREGKHCVIEIADAVEISQTASSRNLAILRDAGFLLDIRDGACIYYYFDINTISTECADLLSIYSKWLGISNPEIDKIKNIIDVK